MVSAGPLVGIGFGNPFVVVSRKAVDQTLVKAKDPDFWYAVAEVVTKPPRKRD